MHLVIEANTALLNELLASEELAPQAYLWGHDPASGSVWFEASLFEALGIEPQEGGVKRLSAHLLDPEAAQLQAWIQGAGGECTLEVRLRHALGGDVRLRFRRHRASSGALHGVALRIPGAASPRLTFDVLARQAIAATKHGVTIADAAVSETPLIFVNEAFCAMTGYSREEVLGRNCRFLQGDDRSQAALAGIRRAIERRESHVALLRNYRKDGGHFWNRFSLSPIRADDGSVRFFVGVQEDVTAEVEARLALTDSEAKLQAVFAAVPEGILTVDARGQILTSNRSAERMFAAEESGLEQRRVTELIPELRCAELPLLAQTASGVSNDESGPSYPEFVGRRLDGTSIPVSLSLGVCPGATESIYTLVLRDVSEARRREAELRAAKAEAEQAAAAKGQFLAQMSHELRNPLVGILGYTDLLEEIADDPLQREYIAGARSSASTLLELMDNVLDLSRLESGRIQAQDSLFDLGVVLKDAVKAAYARAEEKGLRLIVDIDPALPRFRTGDRVRLRQIVTNLLQNAVKFTANGYVKLRVEGEAATTQGKGRVTIEVSDTGIGIPERDQSRIFERFVQVDGSAKVRYGGAGLGLAICAELCQLLGGAIRLMSKEGSGSTFTAELPLGVPHDAIAMIGPLDRIGGNVLVADADPLRAASLVRWLTAMGCEVSHVTSLEGTRHKASAVLDGGRCVIVDVHLARRPGCLRPLLDAGARITLVGAVDGLAEVRRIYTHDQLGLLAQPPFPWEVAELVRKALLAGEPDPRARKRPRVLVADDDAVNRTVLAHMLVRLGCPVETVDGGRAALARHAATPFDVILLDRQMPDIDGFEVASEIRKREGEGKRAAIVLVTGDTLQETRRRVRKVGIDAYMIKPVSLAQLAAFLQLHDPDVASGSDAISRAAFLREVERRQAETPRPAPQLERDSIRVRADELWRAVGTQGLVETLQLFKETAADLLHDLQVAAAADDSREILSKLHALKGNSANVGVDSIAEACARLEGQVRGGAPVRKPDLAFLRDQLQAAGATIDQVIASVSHHHTPR